MITVALGLSACGSSDSAGSGSQASADPAAFVPSAGAQVPTVDLKFGMKPFPDSTFYAIGIKRGYFDAVGLNIVPKPFGTAVTPDNVVALLKNGDVDIVTINGPTMVKYMAQVPDERMFGFGDTYEATYLLASPKSGVKSAAERIKAGEDPAKAIHDAMEEVKGRAVAFNNTGSQRVFLNTIFKEGDMTFKDVKLTVTDDAKIVQLAMGGQIEFATPDGAGQNVQLLKQGWYPVVSVTDLAAVPGNEAVVSASLSNEGPAALNGYLKNNTETALRFLSVMYRIIDEIEKNPDSALADQLPYLNSRSGANLDVEGLKQIYSVHRPAVGICRSASILGCYGFQPAECGDGLRRTGQGCPGRWHPAERQDIQREGLLRRRRVPPDHDEAEGRLRRTTAQGFRSHWRQADTRHQGRTVLRVG
ncbi:ABC transporter substrate-binding protein [Nonomuraea basaltis]|uniref:ABC transporter substrate-binding protein n=1 Tax=Nonomuraea basaltis TaxID=2495887 RepID=UPI00110C5FD3|nr:ABC transporter substrate-binding protein [Nonomuraea basaltis]TMR92230.1 ABC transporter substrate-binding protein [Nonomuraea basaltis]